MPAKNYSKIVVFSSRYEVDKISETQEVYSAATIDMPILEAMTLIQVDIGGHPPIPLAQKQYFQFGSFSMIFRVLNFQGHFEALNDIFLALQQPKQ